MNLLFVSLMFLITTIPFWISFSTLASTGKSDILALVRNLELHRSYFPDFMVITCGREDSNLHGIAPTTPSKWRVYHSATAAYLSCFISSDLSKTFLY